ncbi:MAG: outer membrane protein assembly factor BamB family protein [Planctomycetota bacterium]|jgi:outer membrane protein assembly factor BamB
MKKRVSLTANLVLLVLILSFPAQGIERKPQGQNAREIVNSAAVRGGLIVHLGCGDGRLTTELRVNDRYIVQGLDTDATNIKKAREHIKSLGIYGKVTADTFDGKHLPYADNLVNLLVVSNGKFQVSNEEMMRVLAPRGVAIINGKKTIKPWPKDIDEWTHFLHGANNNAVAEDTRIEPPRYTQWVSGPRWGRSHDHLSSLSAAVSASGRIFYIMDEGPISSVKAPSVWMLVARDAFNGVMLWKKKIAPWEDQLRPFRSGPAEMPRRLVAVGERVYVTLGYGKPVTALDAATGEVVRTYKETENTHEIIAHGDNLYLVISAPLKEDSPTTGKVLRRFPVWRGSYLEYVTQYMPKHICVVNAESGKLVWKKEDSEVTHILPLTLAVNDGKLFFQNGDNLVALKASSGKVVWRAKRPAVRHRYAWLTPTLVVEDGIVLSADRSPRSPVDTGGQDKNQIEWRVSANHILTGGDIMAFSAKTGKQLWTNPCHEGFNSPVDLFVANGKVWSGILAWGKQPGITKVYDLHTGEVVATRSPDQKTYTLGFGHTRCYRHKATTKYVIHGRAGVEFLDMNADRVIADHWVRGACQYGILPCNGLVYAPTHPCACYITAKLSGFNALAGGRHPAPEAESQMSNRLEKGPAYSEVIRSRRRNGVPADRKAEVDKKQWPTYRGDNARSGATGFSLSPKLRPRWEKALAGPLTAVVAAEGRLFVAQKDAHTVHALKADDGARLWSYITAGRVDSPPTIEGGLVYFGSADGWMYCLRAGDGKLAWRFRMAPESRQVVSYGQLESVWPVHGNVLVCRKSKDSDRLVAYAAAGRTSYVDGGVYLYGVDAVTGEVVTERQISHRDPKTGQEPQKVIRGTNMPGAIPDVLSTDGTSLFMRHQRFNFDGRTLEPDIDHLYSSAGFLDDTWWHRTYLQIGRDMSSGYGGWVNVRISGKTLVRNEDRAFGFGRKEYTITGSHLGLQSEYHLFAADIEPIKSTEKPKKRKKSQVKYLWSEAIGFYPRAMLLAGETLFLAGPSEIFDFTSRTNKGQIWLWAVSTKDGARQAEYKLKAAPVYDSFAAYRDNLYFTTVDSRIVCYQPEK